MGYKPSHHSHRIAVKVEYGIGPLIPSFKVPGIRVPGSKLKIQTPSHLICRTTTKLLVASKSEEEKPVNKNQ